MVNIYTMHTHLPIQKAFTPPLRFFALHSKNLLITHTWNFLTFPNFWLRIPLWNFFQQILFTPSDSILGTPSTKILFYFCFNQKHLVEIILWYHSKMKILVLDFWQRSNFKASKLIFFSKKFNGSICAYRVFYPPIFRRIEGGVESTPPPHVLAVPKKAWSWEG